MKTKRVYLEHMDKTESTATVLETKDTEKGKALILDETIFYPQGGGQPFDTGKITAAGKEFIVKDVRNNDGIVHHYGEGAQFANGTRVSLNVDKTRRTLHSKLHSAGHLIDVALAKLGHRLEPGKGYHFPDAPFVEYVGVLPQDEAFLKQVQQEMDTLVTHGSEVRQQNVPHERVKELTGFSADYLDKNEPARLISIDGHIWVPCGGTHVKNVKELGKVLVTKIKVKGNTSKVSYSLA